MKRSALLYILCLATLAAVAVAGASVDEFRAGPGIAAGSSVDRVAVTPDDRYVLAVDAAGGTLSFLDTWDFGLVPGATVSFGNTLALSLAVSPRGDFAYAGLDNGLLAVVDLSPLYDLLPYESLSSPLTVYYPTVFSGGTPVEHLAAIPSADPDSANTFLLLGTANGLYWALHQGSDLVTNLTRWTVTHTPVDIKAGSRYGYELFIATGGDFGLQVISCNDQVAPSCALADQTYSSVTLGVSDSFFGLGPDRLSDSYLLTGNTSDSELWLLNSPLLKDNFNQVNFGDTTPLPAGPVDMAVLEAPTAAGELAFSAWGSTVRITEFDLGSLLFSGNLADVSAGAALLSLAASGGTDGYVYAGADDGGVYPITANPLVGSIAVNGGVTVTEASGDTVSVSFVLDSLTAGEFSFTVYSAGPFKSFSGVLSSGTAITAGPGVTGLSGSIVSSELAECENAVTIVAEDPAGRRGRNTALVVRDFVPPLQSFNAGFGDRRISVSFTARKLCDLAGATVFYGTDPAAGNSLSQLSGSTAYTALPLGGLASGEEADLVIEGLVNGVTYYVLVVLYDQSGNYSVSGPRTVVPQPVAGFTDVTGEGGEGGCLGSVGPARGDPRGAALLFLPAAGVALWNLWRRRKRWI